LEKVRFLFQDKVRPSQANSRASGRCDKRAFGGLIGGAVEAEWPADRYRERRFELRRFSDREACGRWDMRVAREPRPVPRTAPARPPSTQTPRHSMRSGAQCRSVGLQTCPASCRAMVEATLTCAWPKVELESGPCELLAARCFWRLPSRAARAARTRERLRRHLRRPLLPRPPHRRHQ